MQLTTSSRPDCNSTNDRDPSTTRPMKPSSPRSKLTPVYTVTQSINASVAASEQQLATLMRVNDHWTTSSVGHIRRRSLIGWALRPSSRLPVARKWLRVGAALSSQTTGITGAGEKGDCYRKKLWEVSFTVLISCWTSFAARTLYCRHRRRATHVTRSSLGVCQSPFCYVWAWTWHEKGHRLNSCTSALTDN